MNTILAYRGEYGDTDAMQLHTQQATFYFSNDPVCASHYAMSPNRYADMAYAPRVYPVYLKIERPFFNDGSDAFLELSYLEEKLGTEEAFRLAGRFSDWIRSTDNWRRAIDPDDRYATATDALADNPALLTEMYFNIYPYLADFEEVSRLKRLGYDGAIHAGNGQTSTSIEYCIFDRNQATFIFDLSLR